MLFFHFKWICRFLRIHMNFFSFFFPFLKISFSKKKWSYIRANVSWISRKILECKSCYTKISNIRKIRSLCQIFKNVKIKKKNSYGFWKINEFIWNSNKDRSPDYLWDNFLFCNLWITFRYYYYEKNMFLIYLIWLIFFTFLL